MQYGIIKSIMTTGELPDSEVLSTERDPMMRRITAGIFAGFAGLAELIDRTMVDSTAQHIGDHLLSGLAIGVSGISVVAEWRSLRQAAPDTEEMVYASWPPPSLHA